MGGAYIDQTELTLTTTLTIHTLKRKVPPGTAIELEQATLVNDQAVDLDAELMVDGQRLPVPVFFGNQGGLAIGSDGEGKLPRGIFLPAGSQPQLIAKTAVGSIPVRVVLAGRFA